MFDLICLAVKDSAVLLSKCPSLQISSRPLVPQHLRRLAEAIDTGGGQTVQNGPICDNGNSSCVSSGISSSPQAQLNSDAGSRTPYFSNGASCNGVNSTCRGPGTVTPSPAKASSPSSEQASAGPTMGNTAANQPQTCNGGSACNQQISGGTTQQTISQQNISGDAKPQAAAVEPANVTVSPSHAKSTNISNVQPPMHLPQGNSTESPSQKCAGNSTCSSQSAPTSVNVQKFGKRLRSL